MEKKITTKQLKEALSGDFDKLIDQVVQAVDNAQPGRIIAGSDQKYKEFKILTFYDPSHRFRYAVWIDHKLRVGENR